jgi:hypothetical protein
MPHGGSTGRALWCAMVWWPAACNSRHGHDVGCTTASYMNLMLCVHPWIAAGPAQAQCARGECFELQHRIGQTQAWVTWWMTTRNGPNTNDSNNENRLDSCLHSSVYVQQPTPQHPRLLMYHISCDDALCTLQAVAHCRRAGIRVAMVTGDHPLTGEAIARKVLGH